MIIRKNLRLAEFQRLAYKLGLKHKKHDLVIGLSGNLGSGKTAFVKQFAKALGIKQVKSPTFIIMAAYYLDNRRKFYHLDLYRIKHISQLRPIELDEALNAKHRIIMIEWIDKFPKIAKQCNILIHLDTASKNTRNVYIKKP